MLATDLSNRTRSDRCDEVNRYKFRNNKYQLSIIQTIEYGIDIVED